MWFFAGSPPPPPPPSLLTDELAIACIAGCALIPIVHAAFKRYQPAQQFKNCAHMLYPPALAYPMAWAASLLCDEHPETVWRRILSSHRKPAFTAFIFMALLATYFLMGGVLLLADLSERPSWLHAMRAQKSRDAKMVLSKLPRLLLLASVSNMLLGSGTMICSALFLDLNLLPLPTLSADVPRIWRFVRDVWLLELTYEVVFYYSHRALHSKTLYPCVAAPSQTNALLLSPLLLRSSLVSRSLLASRSLLLRRIHKIHHEWKAPIALAATHAHPLEFAISNAGPALAGVLLWQPHYLSLLFYAINGLASTLWDHSGYEFIKVRAAVV